MADGGVNVSMDSAPESGVARGYKFWATNSTLKKTVVLLAEADELAALEAAHPELTETAGA